VAVRRNVDLLRLPRGVRQGLDDVLGFQVGVLAENFISRPSCGDKPNDGPTVTRMPRMHGFPAITAGSRVTRVSCGNVRCSAG
jgi:hypothetical protein